mgnify:CR=1 FL=1
MLAAIALVSTACGTGSGDDPIEDEQSDAGAATGDVGDPVPVDSFEMFSGEPATLNDYAGRPVVVNFWASWCPSCVAEMSAAFLPAQLSLGDQVDFLGLNIQDEREKALELVNETGVLFDLAEDREGALYTALGGLGMPFTVFVSADGRVVAVHNGPLTESQLVDKIVEVLLS